MGQKSKEKIICKIYLSITNLFLNKVIDAIKNANLKKMFLQKTNGYAKLIDIIWDKDSRTGYTIIELTLVLIVDMYHIVRINKGKVVANLAKLFKKKRRRQICLEIESKIRKAFYNQIYKKTGCLSFLSGLAVKITKVNVG